jgi:hypothetical protein
LVYLPAIFVTFAVSDDYTFLYEVKRHEIGLSRMIVEGGRPLYALGNMWAFSAMHGIGDLRWLRAFAVVGIAALATTFYRALEGEKLPRPAALAFCLLIGLMPSFQVYVAWPSTAFYPWSALLAGVAFTAIDPSRTVRLSWRCTTLAVVLLTAAIAIYQPAAMMFWLFAGIAWLTPSSPPRRRDIVRAGAVMGAALAADYALAQGLPVILYSETSKFARSALVTDIPQKIKWFFSKPLLDALNLPLIAPRVWVASLLIIFVISGLWLYFHGTPTTRLARMALAAILLPLSYLPNLLVAENWSSYRTQVAMTGLILLYTAMALVGWLRRLRWQRLLPVCSVVAVITCAGLATRNLLIEFVLPQTLEYRIVAHALRETNLEGATHFYFVTARRSGDTLAPIVRYDEFGFPSSSAFWVPRAMAWLILQAAHSPYADLVASASGVGDGPAPPGSTVIDLGKALRE